MGCVASRIDKEERVQVCRERKKLMKQLLVFRREFADAQFAYLKALKNTGVTLRQFTESESLELENTHYGSALPPSPPLPLPPSPPPPPPLSPDVNKLDNSQKEDDQEESTEITEDHTTSTPVIPSCYLFEPIPPYCWPPQDEMVETGDEENWAETKTEFDEEQEGEAFMDNVAKRPLDKSQPVGLVDDNSSTMSWVTKDTADMPMVLLRSKRTVEGITKELDDCFLKASDGIKEIAVLMDINGRDRFLFQNLKESNGKYKLYDPSVLYRHCGVCVCV